MIVGGMLALLAGPVGASPVLAPTTVTIATTVHIVGIHYVDMSVDPTLISYMLTVHNAGATTAMVDVSFGRVGGPPYQQPKTVHVPAKSNLDVLVQDKIAGINCSPRWHASLLGVGADTTERTITYDSDCTFKTNPADNPPATQAGHAFLANTTAPAFTSTTCSGLKVGTDVENKTSLTATGLEVTFRDVNNGAVLGTSTVASLAPGAKQHVTFSPPKIEGSLGKAMLILTDPKQSLQGKVAVQGMGVQIIPSCTTAGIKLLP
jgi:hypothetical protein